MDSSVWILAVAAGIVLLSWIGLGSALLTVLRLTPQIRSNWAFRAASGMAVVITIGGVTNLLRITSVGVLDAVTLLGVIACFFTAIQHLRRNRRRHSNGGSVWFIPLIALGSAIFVSSLQSTRINPGDDQIAYLLFPRQMLQSGTLLAPFNMRRLGTYGGQQFLQAQILATAQTLSPDNGERLFATHGTVLDTGLSAILSAGLLYGLMRPRSRRQHLLTALVVLAFLSVPIPRVNTHAQMSGTLFFLALFYTLRSVRRAYSFSSAVPILAGLFAAALATLRMNFVPAGAVMIVLTFLFSRPRRRFNIRTVTRAAIALAVTSAILIPWAIVLFQSSGTPFYPLIKGFQQGSFLETPMPFLSHLRWMLSTILFPPILALLSPMTLLPWSRPLRGMLPLYAAAIVVTLATAWSYTQVDATTIYRYCSPLLIPCAFAALGMALRRWNSSPIPVRRWNLAILVIIPCTIAHPFSEAFRASYPVLLGPVLLLILWLARRKPSPLKTAATLFAIALALQGGLANYSRMADNSGLFFYFSALIALTMLAWFSPLRIIRAFAALVAAILSIAGILAISHIFGAVLVLSMTLLALAAIATLRLTRQPLSSTTSLMVTAICVTALFIAAANLPFILDNFYGWLAGGCVAAIAWLAWQSRDKLMCAVAATTIALFVLSGSTAVPGPLPFAVSLPIAWVSIAASLGVRRLFPNQVEKWVPAILLLGAAYLAVAEFHSRILAVRDPSAALAQQHVAELSRVYPLAQQSIPAHAPFFALVANPALLDYARNPINQCDFEIEFISPPPKIPLAGSPELLRQYWKNLGIRYVILSETAVLPIAGLPPAFRTMLLKLESTSRVVFDQRPLTVIDLGP